MIATVKTSEGLVYAFIEYGVIDKEGIPTKDGKYLFVYDAWIHNDHKNTGALREMIAQMFEATVGYTYEFVMYNRDKYNGKPSRIYCASKYLKHTRIKKQFSEVK